MTKRIYSFVTLLTLLTFTADNLRAQEPEGGLRLTLTEAQQMALKNNPTMRISELEVDLARNNAEKSRQQRIPQLYGDVNLQRNLILPTTPVPARAFDPSAGEDELIHLRFTTKWTANTGINASVDLFNPEQAGSIQRASLEAGLSEADRRLTENQLMFEVGNAFYACMIADEQLRLAEMDTLTRRKILDMHERQFEKGRINRADLNLAKTELNNSRMLLSESQMIYDNAKDKLLVFLGIAPDQTVAIRLIGEADFTETKELAAHNEANDEPVALQRLRREQAINILDYKIARRSFLPVVSLNSYYGANYFDNRFDIFKSGNWYGNSFVNVGVRIPLSDHLLRKKELARLKIHEEIISENIKSATLERQQTIQEAERDVRYNQSLYYARKENLDMAEETTRIIQLQYDSGRLLLSDYYQQLYQFQKERAAYLESKYRLLISKLSLEKAKSD